MAKKRKRAPLPRVNSPGLRAAKEEGARRVASTLRVESDKSTLYLVVLTKPLSSHTSRAAAVRAAGAVKLGRLDKVVVIRETQNAK